MFCWPATCAAAPNSVLFRLPDVFAAWMRFAVAWLTAFAAPMARFPPAVVSCPAAVSAFACAARRLPAVAFAFAAEDWS